MVLVVGATTALAIGQCSISRHLEKLEVRLEQLAGRLDVSSRDDGQPRFAYQGEMRSGITREDLREVLREELSGLRGAETAVSAGEEASAKPSSASLSPENAAAFQSAERIVQNAVRSGIWGENETAEMRSLMPQLTQEQLQTIHSTLFPAVNSQQIRVQVAGPLF